MSLSSCTTRTRGVAACAVPERQRTAVTRTEAARSLRRKPPVTAVRILSGGFSYGHTGPKDVLGMRSLRVALVVFFLSPAAAWAAGPAIRSQDLPIGVSRTTAGAAAPQRFDLVGLHWQGPG